MAAEASSPELLVEAVKAVEALWAGEGVSFEEREELEGIGRTLCGSGEAADLFAVLCEPSALVGRFSRSEGQNALVDYEAACALAGRITSPVERRALQFSLEKTFKGRHVRCSVKGPPGPARAWVPATGSSSASSWVPVALAVALPLLEGAMPTDEHGMCVIPHPHPLRQQKIRARLFTNALGEAVYDTKRACDNCDEPIEERIFYSCASGCKVDFCTKCHKRLQLLFKDLDQERVNWITSFVGCASTYVLQAMGAAERRELARVLASDWPKPLFERLVDTVVGVLDALVVHFEDNGPDVASNKEFWHMIGFLQLLYSANTLPAETFSATASSSSSSSSADAFTLCQRSVAEPRIDLSRFAVRGIDKCDAQGEYQRWCEVCTETTQSIAQIVLAHDSFDVTPMFASFLTHSNLVPISFRQRCLKFDVFMGSATPRYEIGQEEFSYDCAPMKLKRSPRDSMALFTYVISAFGRERPGSTCQQARPLCVSFQGEPAEGPGVTREFLLLAMRSLLECSSINTQTVEPISADAHWEYDTELRTYWFREAANNHDNLIINSSMHACGALLGHAVFSGMMLPAFFPPVLYTLLLRDFRQDNHRPLTLADLASVSPAMARSLERLLEYEGDDFEELFCCLDWPRGAELKSSNRREHVHDYVQWFFTERYASQLTPLSAGFRAVCGRSKLLKVGLVDGVQLEQIICGVERPVDPKAIHSGATIKDFDKSPSDAEYLESFWEVLHSLRAEDLRRFIVFVSACGRTPPRGWQDLSITIQRHGEGDDRLPTAFTCFNLFFLPRYSSKEVLRERILLAITETEGFGLR